MKYLKVCLILPLMQLTLVFCHRNVHNEVVQTPSIRLNSREQLFEAINNMIMDKVPPHASFVRVVSKIPASPGRYWTPEYLGWILTEDSVNYIFLDCSAQKIKIKKSCSSVYPASLKDESEKALQRKGVFRDPWRPVREHAGFELVPFYVLADWCYENNLKDQAAALIDNLSNRKMELLEMLDFMFGNLYYNEMLYAYSQERDYKKAVLFSEHLGRPEFNEFEYKTDAIHLGEQLKMRHDDFVTLKLPSPDDWDSLKYTLSRADRIKYLCKRLRLLNCIQISQPGDISYNDIQYSVPSVKCAGSEQFLGNWPFYGFYADSVKYKVINPYTELMNMRLKPADIKLVAPYLADQDYIVAYSFHRDFKSERNLHTVSRVVSGIILSSVGRSFVDPKTFSSLDNRSQRKEIRKIIRWCNRSDYKSDEELTLSTLKNTNKWSEFRTAMKRCLENKYTEAVPVLLTRINDFEVAFQPLVRDRIAETILELAPGGRIAISKLRELTANSDNWVKLRASLYIIKFKEENFEEGFNVLKQVLDSCDGTTWYPRSIDILLESRHKEAHELADGILDKPGFRQEFDWPYNNEQLKNLFLSGSEKAYRFVLNGLKDMRTDPGFFTEQSCERYMNVVNGWRGEKECDYYSKSLQERKLICKQMSKWVDNQFRLVKSGKEPVIKRMNVDPPVFSIDAPGI